MALSTFVDLRTEPITLQTLIDHFESRAEAAEEHKEYLNTIRTAHESVHLEKSIALMEYCIRFTDLVDQHAKFSTGHEGGATVKFMDFFQHMLNGVQSGEMTEDVIRSFEYVITTLKRSQRALVLTKNGFVKQRDKEELRVKKRVVFALAWFRNIHLPKEVVKAILETPCYVWGCKKFTVHYEAGAPACISLI